jgi:hypothetical protein
MILDANTAQRAAYEARAARSEPGREPEAPAKEVVAPEEKVA